ncbi:LPS translocon maturation chaperone LptM [Methyloglobulus sp.]|uniref:LPS translocon maturation chaperone LptM n=1 Tax=Methyloglobulus sp. TaxID=2518622 RepID=UPI00398A3D58
MMKDYRFALFLLCLVLPGCGQPGPLYLPSDKPPIYVEPEPAPETKDKETRPEPPPQPKIKQPAKKQ